MNETVFSTKGRNIFPDYEMPICCIKNVSRKIAFPRDRFSLIIVAEGGGIISTGIKKQPLISSQCLCFNEGEDAEIDCKKEVTAYCVYFHPSVINQYLNFKNIRSLPGNSVQKSQDTYWLLPFLERTEQFSGVIQLGPNSILRALQLYDQLERELKKQSDSFWPCRSRAYFLELLFYLSRIYMNKADARLADIRGVDGDIEQLIVYLNENYGNKITIKDITDRLCTNRTTISKKLLKATNVSIMEYLNSIRINMACVLLRDTALPVSEIVYRVGFNDPAHFLRSFKKAIKLSPSAYREKNNWMFI